MPYATKAQLEDVWGESFVADLLPEDVDADTAVARALDQASDEIDLHLSARYTLPLATPPAALVTPAANIAVYILANRHSALTQTIEDRYEQTVELLKRIAEGKAGLGADEPHVVSDDPDASAGGASFSANERLFSRRTLP
jgi:phage gp36-like protein